MTRIARFPRRTVLPFAPLLLTLLLPARLLAHCDSVGGPVAADVRAALAAGDPAAVLKWVGPSKEAELREAFARTLSVRKAGDDARALADTWFLETAVRLHRSSEGAPYTGLKPAGGEPAFIAKVEGALDAGSIDEFARLVGEHASAGVKARFATALSARREAGKGVAEGRAWVAAYVDLIHYVEAVVGAVHAEAGHAHAPAPAHAD